MRHIYFISKKMIASWNPERKTRDPYHTYTGDCEIFRRYIICATNKKGTEKCSHFCWEENFNSTVSPPRYAFHNSYLEWRRKKNKSLPHCQAEMLSQTCQYLIQPRVHQEAAFHWIHLFLWLHLQVPPVLYD